MVVYCKVNNLRSTDCDLNKNSADTVSRTWSRSPNLEYELGFKWSLIWGLNDQVGFQIEALSSVSDWLISKNRFLIGQESSLADINFKSLLSFMITSLIRPLSIDFYWVSKNSILDENNLLSQNSFFLLSEIRTTSYNELLYTGYIKPLRDKF